MPRRLPEPFREPELVRWSDIPGVAMAFGIALLVGLVSGLIWIGWNLFKLYFLR